MTLQYFLYIYSAIFGVQSTLPPSVEPVTRLLDSNSSVLRHSLCVYVYGPFQLILNLSLHHALSKLDSDGDIIKMKQVTIYELFAVLVARIRVYLKKILAV